MTRIRAVLTPGVSELRREAAAKWIYRRLMYDREVDPNEWPFPTDDSEESKLSDWLEEADCLLTALVAAEMASGGPSLGAEKPTTSECPVCGGCDRKIEG